MCKDIFGNKQKFKKEQQIKYLKRRSDKHNMLKIQSSNTGVWTSKEIRLKFIISHTADMTLHIKLVGISWQCNLKTQT